MKKKLNKKVIRIIILLGVVFLVFNVLNSRNNVEEVEVRDYMPNKPMVKIFEGGFEGAGTVEVIDKISGEFYQKKSFDTGTVGVSVYQVAKKSYKLVYRDGENKKVEGNYIDKKSNLDLILLRAPIKKGVSWINPDDSTYKIISVDEKIKLIGKEVKAIKLRYRKDGYEYYIYFAKNLGIVRIDSEMGESRLKEVKYDVESYLEKLNK
ncbi:MAG: hypothetical protein KAH04_06715 [Psychrilyobacter sp.]|nr:hypothetical protein [Psychrilyobacter sp.]